QQIGTWALRLSCRAPDNTGEFSVQSVRTVQNPATSGLTRDRSLIAQRPQLTSQRQKYKPLKNRDPNKVRIPSGLPVLGGARICGSSGSSGCFLVTREEMSMTFSRIPLETNRTNRFNRN